MLRSWLALWLLLCLIVQATQLRAAAPAAPAPAQQAPPVTATGTVAPPAPTPKPPPPPPRLNALPVEHAYQKTLRDYLGTLKPADFEHGITEKFNANIVVADPEEQYRYYFSSLTLFPLVGTKRGVPAVNTPAENFVLGEIETSEGVKRPPIYPDAMAQLIHWKYDGNPYYGSKALKMRAFVVMVINLVMLDEQLEHAPELGGSRTDWLAPSVLAAAFPYRYVTDVVPEPVRAAYRVGLEKMGRRILDWGPKEEEPNLDVVATVALWYISQALDDPKFTTEAEAYARRYYTDPRYFHPAGYFVDRGGIDLGFSGQTNYFATWLALASKWPFVANAVDKIHRLRAHVTLPQPDGKTFLGPSHYHNRFSADAWKDQWEWGAFRDTAASLVTDEAAYLTNPLTAEELAAAATKRAQWWQFQINENPKLREAPGYMKNEDIANSAWRFTIWPSYNFPAQVNYGYAEYPAGAYAHRKSLEDAQSPLLKSPFLRAETFVREFASAFVATKQPSYAAVLHTGPIGKFDQESSFALLPGPYGFGGGQLSAFWTPATGSVLLGRRAGQHWDANFDLLEDWRKWPIHAVSGVRVDGRVFTTARITEPAVITDLKADGGTVRASGVVPRNMLGQTKALDGRLEFARAFTLGPDGVRIETTLATTGQDNFAELYETLPVLMREGPPPKTGPDTATTIEFRTAKGTWTAANSEWTDGVIAVRLARFGGAVLVEFDGPRRVKLGEEWADKFLSRVVCRNVLIDLIEQNDKPAVLREAATSYTVRAEKS
jgi:hypothetical protein